MGQCKGKLERYSLGVKAADGAGDATAWSRVPRRPLLPRRDGFLNNTHTVHINIMLLLL